MKQILSLLAIACLFSCSSKKDSLVNKYLNSNNIPVQKITIDVTKDTSLVLKGGTKLHIPKGTLKTKDNQPAVLQVKEVLTPEQILASGMFTESNGKPLSSGGMLFIDADSSVDVEMAGKIIAEIPTKALDEKMQLFKGEKEDDGTINWTDPGPLQFNKADSSDIGKQLFMQNCASCHDPVKDVTGPALAGADLLFARAEQMKGGTYESESEAYNDIKARRSIYDYIRNPVAFEAYDDFLCMITNRYAGQGTQMPAFPTLSERDIDWIMNYVNKEAIEKE